MLFRSWFSPDTNNQPTTDEAWTRIAVPNAKTLDDLFGVTGDATGVWVTGSDNSDQPAVWRCTDVKCDQLGALALPAAYPTGRVLAGFAVNATAIHLVGAATKATGDGTLSPVGKAVLAWSTVNAGFTWNTPVTIATSTTIRLGGIAGLNANKIWAIGASSTANQPAKSEIKSEASKTPSSAATKPAAASGPASSGSKSVAPAAKPASSAAKPGAPTTAPKPTASPAKPTAAPPAGKPAPTPTKPALKPAPAQ